MIDRQDIDALLISALYGELSLADEARLTAHLESHPADRNALEGLTQTRDSVRESRILSVQLDPPQAISAILLQEAARRAPRRVVATEDNQVSWFQRFVRSFATHPAMAAAAMLVVVIGFAGIMHNRKGDQFVEQTIDSRGAMTPAADQAPAAVVATGSGSAASDRWASDDGLRDTTTSIDAKKTESLAKDRAGAAAPKLDEQDAFRVDLAEDSKLGYKPQLEGKPSPKKGKTAGIEVRTPGPAPKDFATPETKADSPKREVSKNLKQSAEPSPEIASNNDPSPPPPPPSKSPGYATPPSGAAGAGSSVGITSTAPRNAPITAPAAPTASDKAVVAKPAKPAEEKSGDATLLAWAKDKHVRVTTLVRAGSCQEAAKSAAEIATRAPDYYNQNVVNDRALKQCIAYINDAREKDAERSNKSRAQKRIDANEVSPSPAPAK